MPEMRRPAPLEERRVVRRLCLAGVLLPVPAPVREWVRDLRTSLQRRRAEARRREYLRLADEAERSLSYQMAVATETRRSTMVDPMAQAEVESEIRRLSRQLDRVTDAVAMASTREAEADVSFKLAHAKALLAQAGSKVTVALKEAQALVDVEEEFAEAKLAAAKLRGYQEMGRNLRSQLDGLRSINANVRAVVTNP